MEKNTGFAHRVYTACRRIPKGRVSTYKEIAKALKSKAYRAVGQALRNNPYAPVVPCHRVVASDGSLGGFNGKRKGASIRRKMKLLEEEGIRVTKGKIHKIANFSNVLHRF